MSLTSFLKRPEVKERFQMLFEVPKIKVAKTLLAPPLTKRYALVGTAFDYLLRFYLQRRNKHAVCRRWVAQDGLESLELDGSWGYDIDNDKLLDDLNPVTVRARTVFRHAQAAHKRYISSGRLTDSLLESAMHLAQLDSIRRNGHVDENLGVVHDEDIKDLRNLMSIVEPKLFRANSICILNPTFGKASGLVGGADADLLIDDLLIDIKTVKNLVLKPDYYYQLIGYVILHRIAAIGNLRPKPKINKIGIYFSRYGHLEVIDLRDIIDSKTFASFVKWFAASAADKC